jgi:hypothetical protein
MKQTAVEWLAGQLPLGVKGSILDKIEQAKEMEKQQIIDAYEEGFFDERKGKNVDGEQYYNETFNK